MTSCQPLLARTFAQQFIWLRNQASFNSRLSQLASGTATPCPKQFIGAACLLVRRALGSAANASNSATPQQPLTPEDEACNALYFSGTAPASDILGPTSVAEMPGRGRGLVATRPLAVGDLVMAVAPLAVLHGPQDCMPPPDSLVDHLRARWRQMRREQREAVQQMYGARPEGSAGGGGGPESGRASPAASGAAPEASASAFAATDGVDLHAVVSYNAYGDEYEDLPAVALRTASAASASAASASGSGSPPAGPAPRSLVGLWPHFCRLNHSCAPNCVHYVVGSTMVVRAVQPVPAGAELMISYLGRDDLAPRQVRQAVLQSRYGFRCDCPRCRTEEDLPEELQELLLQLHERARHELAPRFERLAAATAAEVEGPSASASGQLPVGALQQDQAEDEDDEEEDTGDRNVEVAAASSGMTAAEAAKRALRKARGSSAAVPGSQLLSLESRMEECARQLNTALQELQEDDEATEDEAEQNGTAAATAGAGPASSSSGVRRLTRVQAAQAASYQLMELLHLHAELTAAAASGRGLAGGRADEAAAAALAACWHVLDAISRGSELQVFQACKLLSDALQQARAGSRGGGVAGARGGAAAAAAPPPEAVREAAALLGQSLVARYGRLRGSDLTRMTQAAIKASRAFF